VRFEFAPTDNPRLAQAEGVQEVARQLERIADQLEDADVEDSDVQEGVA